jgi:hypothetical protein
MPGMAATSVCSDAVLTLTRVMSGSTVTYADVINLWGFPLLDHRDLPYVLLVLAGFIAEHRKGDVTTWTRFWFDGHVRSARAYSH